MTAPLDLTTFDAQSTQIGHSLRKQFRTKLRNPVSPTEKKWAPCGFVALVGEKGKEENKGEGKLHW